MQGTIKKGVKIRMMSTGQTYDLEKIGVFSPNPIEIESLSVGEVGYITAAIKEVRDTKIGDTITDDRKPADTPLPGFKPIKAMVFSGLYPIDTDEYEALKEAVQKLWLNDPAFSFEQESSAALGFGFRCGFLGLLHMEIIKERLEREYNLSLICTAPSVSFKIILTNGEEIQVENPAQMPSAGKIETILEPFVKMEIFTPKEYLGNIISLCEEKRGIQKDMKFITEERVQLHYELPFNEIVLDFYDRLKSISRGYASIDYDFLDHRPAKLVKLDILINKQPVDALSVVVHQDKAYYRGREICEKLRVEIPRHLFEIVIQAAIGSKIVAKERVAPLRKDVTAKCYGGDITRKRKLLEKQKEGKKKMKQLGQVDVPQEAFFRILKV
jgi:GTP-binding protein LepA